MLLVHAVKLFLGGGHVHHADNSNALVNGTIDGQLYMDCENVVYIPEKRSYVIRQS